MQELDPFKLQEQKHDELGANPAGTRHQEIVNQSLNLHSNQLDIASTNGCHSSHMGVSKFRKRDSRWPLDLPPHECMKAQ